MSVFLEFGKEMLTQWSLYLTGGILLAIHFIWDSFFNPVPLWVKAFIIIFGTVTGAFYVWRDKRDQLAALRERLKPRLEIASVPVVIDNRYRIRVNNLSGTTVRFAARLESIEPEINHVMPVHLQITNSPEQEGQIPGHKHALVEVFLDTFLIAVVEGKEYIHGDTIGLFLYGHPPAEFHVPRERYTVEIIAYPVDADAGIPARRSFYIIPPRDGQCIFGDAGAPYQEPI